ncbi:NAD(P)/FAD-dependent oxidoreductase [Clostridiaceae bacterium]|nr:NAD(P)/FAD-dependent oxidoreductase [Clostridiaceae bacterium]
MGNVVIVGGGAAGMMAAVAAAGSGHLVRIYEKNEKLGKKIYITGKGRCNVTNACETEELFAGMVSNPKFLYSGFYGFTSQDMMRFLEENGCPVKVERGNRVFPVSDKSSDVIRAITGQLSRLGVEICLGQEVSGLMARDGQIQGVGLKKGERKVPADAVIVASGGLSYPATGSTGDGYEFARSVGHKVTELSPALTPLEVREQTLVQDLQGLSLKNVRVQIWDGKKLRYEAFGEMLFTHFGVSGPVILSASSYVAKELKKREMVLTVDLKPALDLEQLDSRILRDFEGMKQKMFKNALGLLLPSKLIPVIVGQSEIPPEKPVHAITRKERRQLAERIKDFRLTLTGLRGYREAIITQGGVSVKEINPKTMESKLIRGLYFAGEVLDLDGVTGGYNLQIAWSTGYLAGRSV